MAGVVEREDPLRERLGAARFGALAATLEIRRGFRPFLDGERLDRLALGEIELGEPARKLRGLSCGTAWPSSAAISSVGLCTSDILPRGGGKRARQLDARQSRRVPDEGCPDLLSRVPPRGARLFLCRRVRAAASYAELGGGGARGACIRPNDANGPNSQIFGPPKQDTRTKSCRTSSTNS
jgi:hypothetical protein